MCSCCSTAFGLQQYQQQHQHQKDSRSSSTSSGCCNQSKSVESRNQRRKSFRMRSRNRSGRMISRSSTRKLLPLSRSQAQSPHSSFLLICLLAAVFALIAIPFASSISSNSSSNLNELNEAAPARTTNKEAQLMGKLLKSMQISACDGEIMRIKCREDYTIEILTAEQTILPAKIANNPIPQTYNTNTNTSTNTSTGNHSVRDTLVIQQQTQGTTDRLDPQQQQQQQHAAPSSSSSQDMSQYCPPTNSNNYYQQSLIDQQQQQTLGNARTGNGPTTAAAVANIGQSCNAEEANRKALSRETFVKFVRNECHLRNSCQLDLRWPQQQQFEPRTNLTNQTNIDDQNQTSSNISNGAYFSTTGAGIGRVFNEICPLNRKLAEVIYKCRPQKLTKRTVCRGGELNLECPQDKRLIFAYGSFGAWANDSKSHERCSNEQQQHQETATLSTVINRTQLTQRNCLANETFAVLANACAFKESCKLQVEPAVLGQTNCPVGQIEYMKVIFTCINETLIASRATSAGSNSSLTMATIASTYTMSARARSINGAFNTSSSSSGRTEQFLSLNSSSPMPSSSSLQTTTIGSLIGPQQQQQNQKSSSIIVLASSNSDNKQHDDDDNDEQQQLILANHHHDNSNNMDASNSNIFTLVNKQDDIQLQQQLNRSTRNSNQSSLEQRARYVLDRYPQLLPFIAMLCLSMIIIGFGIKSCSSSSSPNSTRRHLRRGSHSSLDGCSKDSKDSSVGKSSSSSGFKSLGSSAALMQNGPSSSQSTNGSGSGCGAALKHHSFSESHFSLDDTDFGTVTTGATDSPGLPQLPYNFNNNNDNNDTDEAHNYQPATIRPKLWTIHDHHHHHHHPPASSSSSNSLIRTTTAHNSSIHHLSLAHHQQQQANAVNANLALSNTLRSNTRTFVGHQAATTQIGANFHHNNHHDNNHQQQHLPDYNNSHHHSHHQQQPMQLAPPHQFAYQQLGTVSNAADFLLAMATNHHHFQPIQQQQQQQHQQQQQQQAATTLPTSINWCATLTQGQPEEAVANQLAVLSMPPPPPPTSIDVANFTNLNADNSTMQNQETILLQQQLQ